MDAERSPVQVDVKALPGAPSALIEAAVRRALIAEGRPDIEISVALLGDAEIREMNARWLGHDRPTDVLAFALGEGDDMVGDVYIGMDQAERQSGSLGIPLSEELARLAIHGTLHVLGYDHPEGAEREESPMFELQESLLRSVLAEVNPG